MVFKHLTLTSRCVIEKYLNLGYSFREIAAEIGCHGRHQQRLTESPWATQKVIAAFISQLVDESSLVYINISIGTELLKILYSYRVFHLCFA